MARYVRPGETRPACRCACRSRSRSGNVVSPAAKGTLFKSTTPPAPALASFRKVRRSVLDGLGSLPGKIVLLHSGFHRLSNVQMLSAKKGGIMSPWLTQGDENRRQPASLSIPITAAEVSAGLPFVIPSELRNFLPRGTHQWNGCGFPLGKAHELDRSHEHRREIRRKARDLQFPPARPQTPKAS